MSAIATAAQIIAHSPSDSSSITINAGPTASGTMAVRTDRDKAAVMTR
jgi:hypothetical protein